MKNLICIFLMFLTFFSYADNAKNQWKLSHESLNSLVKKGFTIVSVIRLPSNDGAQHIAWTEEFLLQKSGSVYKCFEDHHTDKKSNVHEATFDCLELVDPYSSEK